MRYDGSSALIVVDFQNDFADPEGSLYVPGGEEAVGFVNAEIETAAAAGATLVYSQDWHPESTPHFQKDGGIWPVHCVADSRGADFHPGLDVRDTAIFIKKGVQGEDGYSAFGLRDPVSGETSSTGLADRLQGVEEVFVLGLALDYCVKETALDALRAGFDTTLLADGTRSVDLRPGDGARAVAELVLAGVSVV